jgi:hypothetical protein
MLNSSSKPNGAVLESSNCPFGIFTVPLEASATNCRELVDLASFGHRFRSKSFGRRFGSGRR